jgi:hypothetical protein
MSAGKVLAVACVALLSGCTADDAQSTADFICHGSGYWSDPVAIAVDAAVSLAACFWEPTEPEPGSSLESLAPRPGFIGKSNRTPVHTAPVEGPANVRQE